jgi:hypothetical protein
VLYFVVSCLSFFSGFVLNPSAHELGHDAFSQRASKQILFQSKAWEEQSESTLPSSPASPHVLCSSGPLFQVSSFIHVIVADWDVPRI